MAATNYTPISLYYSTTASAVPSAGNLVNGELAINITDGKLYFKDNGGTVQLLAASSGASGDVVGPASATDNAIARFDGTTGKLIQNSSGVTISDGNVITATGFSGALDGTVGATTPTTVVGTTITANTGFSGPLNGTVGATTPTTGVFTQVDITAQGDLRLQDSSGGEYVAIQAPSTLGASYTLTMPTTDGDADQVLTTDGSGGLSWTTPSSGITTGKSIAMAMIFGF